MARSDHTRVSERTMEVDSASELAALLLAVDGPGLGGAVLDHPLHDVARQFSAAVQRSLPSPAPFWVTLASSQSPAMTLNPQLVHYPRN